MGLRSRHGRSAVPCGAASKAGAAAVVLVAGALAIAARAEAQTPTDRDVEAQRIFQAGQEAFEAAHYDDALTDFQRAYALSNRPELLYNVGVVADRLRHDAEALDAFQRFLAATSVTVEHRADAEARVRVLRNTASAGGARPSDTTATTSSLFVPSWDDSANSDANAGSAADARQGPGVLPWIVLSIGAALVVGGVVLVVAGEGDRSTVENAPTASAWASVSDAASRAPILDGVGAMLVVLGAVGMGAGLVWALSPTGHAHHDDVHVALGFGSLSISGRF